MSDAPEQQTQQVQEVQADLTPKQTVTMGVDEFKNYLNEAAANAVKQAMEQVSIQKQEEYRNLVNESVKNTQATLMKPKEVMDSKQAEAYVTKVLLDDQTRRIASGDGRFAYAEAGEDFLKAKIVILKKMGLNEKEIAENIKDIL